MSELLARSIHPSITEIRLNRPDKRNALSIALLDELERCLEGVTDRVILLRGNGSVFCAGLDLEEAMDPQTRHRSAESVARVLERLYHTSAVTIALVQGAAMAGGAGLLAACDLVVAEPNARIGFPETRRGLVAALVMTILRRRLSGRYLSELLLLAEPISAHRAFEMGLVNRVVPSAQLEQEGLALAEQALQGAPKATSRTKQLMDVLEAHSLTDDLSQARLAHVTAREGDEAAEGIAAFLEKRPPRWV